MTRSDSRTTSAADLLSAVALLDRLVASGEVGGCALAVAVGGDIVGEHYAGEAAPGRVASPDTLWPLASISKLYTAAAVMALVERGDFALDTPVHCLLPRFVGGARERVLVRHLLTHTAGLVYEPADLPRLLTARVSMEEIEETAYRVPLLFAPGARLSYSDLGYALLGRIAAVVAGAAFPEVVRRLVLEPGGLTDTVMPPPRSEDDRLAYVVGPLAEGTPGAMYNSPYARDLAHPAFGTVATARDLVAFGLLFAPNGKRRILAEATIRAMTTDQTGRHLRVFGNGPDQETPRAWGLGFMVKSGGGYPNLAAPGAFGHDGATGCSLWVDPLHDATIAFVANRHFNVDPDGFMPRLDRVIGTTLACLTRRDTSHTESE